MVFIQGEHTLGDGGAIRLPQVDVRPASGLFQGRQMVRVTVAKEIPNMVVIDAGDGGGEL